MNNPELFTEKTNTCLEIIDNNKELYNNETVKLLKDQLYNGEVSDDDFVKQSLEIIDCVLTNIENVFKLIKNSLRTNPDSFSRETLDLLETSMDHLDNNKVLYVIDDLYNNSHDEQKFSKEIKEIIL